jgi:signal transduction histidine kinase
VIDANADEAIPPSDATAPPSRWARRRGHLLQELPPDAPAWRMRLNETFAGITPAIIALAAVVCLVDAIQDVLHTVLRSPVAHSVATILDGFFTSALIALLFVLGVFAALNRFPLPGARQVIAVAIAVIAATAIGVLAKLNWLGLLSVRPQVDAGFYYSDAVTHFVQRFVRYLTLGALFAASLTMYRRERWRAESLGQAEIEQAILDRQMHEARLQALMAQIEPHFLFNTLATMRSLYQSDAAAAEHMVDNLIRYLTVALPRMRESVSTIEREAALAEAYLGIQKIRMGRRLDFSIEVPVGLRHTEVPPMMLLTLVENAIKHGLGQSHEGGNIKIKVSHSDGNLALQVMDTGRGFGRQLGNGAGLANIRARLGALHGSSASLRLAKNSPRGVTATIVIPLPTPETH